MINKKTYMLRKEDISRDWHLIDGTNLILGRLASKIAFFLQGKNKVNFTPHQDCGDYIVVINAEKIHLTGKKWKNKFYYSHSGFPGGLKKISALELFRKTPTLLLHKAVKGMLPKNRLAKLRMNRLFLYVGPQHQHQGQNPQNLSLF